MVHCEAEDGALERSLEGTMLESVQGVSGDEAVSSSVVTLRAGADIGKDPS